MSIALVNCPACAKAVSAAAHSCVQCGHPLRSAPRKRNVGYVFVAGLLAVIGVAGYKLDLHKTWLDSAPSATHVSFEADTYVIRSRISIGATSIYFEGEQNSAAKTKPDAYP